MIVRIAHIILALTVFISSSGLVVNKHFCQDELKSMRLFLATKGCHPDKTKKVCPMHAGDQNSHSEGEKKKGCCDDETQYVKTDDKKLVTSLEIDLPDFPVYLSGLFDFPSAQRLAADGHTLRYLTYRPPIVRTDSPSRLQVFRL